MSCSATQLRSQRASKGKLNPLDIWRAFRPVNLEACVRFWKVVPCAAARGPVIRYGLVLPLRIWCVSRKAHKQHLLLWFILTKKKRGEVGSPSCQLFCQMWAAQEKQTHPQLALLKPTDEPSKEPSSSPPGLWVQPRREGKAMVRTHTCFYFLILWPILIRIDGLWVSASTYKTCGLECIQQEIPLSITLQDELPVSVGVSREYRSSRTH